MHRKCPVNRPRSEQNLYVHGVKVGRVGHSEEEEKGVTVFCMGGTVGVAPFC